MASLFLTKDVAEEALDLFAAFWESFVASGRPKRSDLHVVILDPTIKPSAHTFDEAVLCERSFGDRVLWEHPYRMIAREKAEATWREGMPNGRMLAEAAPLIQVGDTRWGSAYHGIPIVGCSGVQPWFDEMCGALVSHLCRGLAQDERQKCEATLEGNFYHSVL